MSWFCAQIGAREHYAVPQVLHQSGRLEVLYTDFWAGSIWRRMAGSKLEVLRSLATRHHAELEQRPSEPEPSKFQRSGFRVSSFSSSKAEIVSWNARALWWEILRKAENRKSGAERGAQKKEKGRSKIEDGAGEHDFQRSVFNVSAFKNSGPYHGFIEVGRRFAIRVREDLKRRTDLSADAIFYAYDTGALEALEWCREHGVKCVLNQMDPNRVEVDLVRAEEKQWPSWTLEAVAVPEAYFARREREWALADRVVVNSEFSRQALLQQGVPPEKLVVIPLCYEAAESNRKSSGRFISSTINYQPSTGPLRVLFLGQVILRKGIQYLIAAAKLLERENIHFDIVGPVGISAAALVTAPKNMRFHGRTGRDQAAAWYRQSHLFVLPTLSDGFAITQLEAMAHGLPVVTTPCCGEVVSDGVDGFVVPARDAGALAEMFQRYLTEPELLRSQSAAALVKARQFTLERLAENLRQLENSLWKS